MTADGQPGMDHPASDSAPQPPAPSMGRAGLVAVIGRSNVGKSSLLNALLEEKVSIVSPVPQTTRTLVRGILTEPRGQVAFIDTPGVHKAGGNLSLMMNRIARASIEGVDVALLVLDASSSPYQEDEGWMARLARSDVPCLAVFNKSDLSPSRAEDYRALWARVAADRGSTQTPRWLATSALTGAGLPELLSALFEAMPVGPHLFPDDVLTDYPRKLNMADIVREKLFADLRDELPHAIAVCVEDIRESPQGWNADVDIYVNRDSQKGIVIGHKGRQLRKVRRAAELELTQMYSLPVTLHFRVKVENHWDRNFWLLKKFGYAAQ
jgi:GTPase